MHCLANWPAVALDGKYIAPSLYIDHYLRVLAGKLKKVVVFLFRIGIHPSLLSEGFSAGAVIRKVGFSDSHAGIREPNLSHPSLHYYEGKS